MLAVLVGCGRFGFDPLGGDGGSSADACAFGPWGTPERIPELSSTSDDFGGQISVDGLTYYFRSNRSGNGDLYYAQRTTRDAAFGPVIALTTLNTGFDEIEIAPSPDELEVYYSSSAVAATQCLFHASRTDRALAFSNITRFDSFCATSAAVGAFVTLDNLTLYYTLESGMGPEGTILVTTRAATGDTFVVGTPVVGLEGMPNKGYPVLTPDGLTIYFEAAISGMNQLFQATRASTSSPFGSILPIPGINEPGAVAEDVSITTDGVELFFASLRADSTGKDDFYVAKRACL